MEELNKNFYFRGNEVVSLNGNSPDDFKPFFEYIEEYCLENCGSTKWVEEMLVVYVANFNKIDYKKCDLSDYYTQFIFAIYSKDSTEYDEEYSTVYFGEDVEPINSFSDLNDALDKIIQKNVHPSLYKCSNEKIVPEKPEFSQEDFLKELKILRISEDEFLNAIRIYNSINGI